MLIDSGVNLRIVQTNHIFFFFFFFFFFCGQNSKIVLFFFFVDQDELLWAAAWLHRATDDKSYLDYLGQAGNTGGARTEFSWDDKFVGAQVLVAKAEQFICSCIQKGNSNVKKTPGGLLWFLPFNNLQYTTTATLIATVYSEYLSPKRASIQCSGGIVQSSALLDLARSQVDYILGSNPNGMSYMVGFGSKYPTQVHHRGASIVSIKKDPSPVACQAGFDAWFNMNAPNPNVLDGAIVGGPNDSDGYTDSRSNFQMAEAATVNTAPLVGVLAKLA
ncbi:putative cellulase [Rosa chinensis]|uniref:Endoglucanase n=1 Tax=Rosa chinensis TaxID=74649 RepID=A0A2P6SQI6_ROSCH|nr:putative cellulase [Rosa chinensis]